MRIRPGAGHPPADLVVRRAPARELAVYGSPAARAATGAPALRGVLSSGPGPGAATGAASVAAASPPGAWLLLEAVPGYPPDFSDPAEVHLAYAHLGAFHRRCAGLRLPWVPAATAEPVRNLLLQAGVSRSLANEAACRLGSGPATLLHGDYHRWNLAVNRRRVRVFDWEHSAWGHPAWDLALLAPDAPPRDDLPSGALALEALRAYHRAGPLCDMPVKELCRLQGLAALHLTARLLNKCRQDALAAPPGPRAVLLAHAERQEQRIARTARLLARGVAPAWL